jgi:glycosyltransferase involved in cell wall biosynthesis
LKILYYNWLPFDNARNEGGGVNIYQRNLIEELVKDNSNDIYFLSSGWKHNPFKASAYIKETENIFGGKCKSFEIINSPVPAPAAVVFNDIKKYLNDEITLNLFEQFIEKHGGFDVIHINNIEGISINVLKIKEKYPGTKIILSLHNYVPICPLVQYFQNHNECICHNFDEGRECLNCAVWKISSKKYLLNIRHYLRDKTKIKAISGLLPYLFRFKASGYVSEKLVSTPADFAEYRRKNIEYINKYVDCVLAVSDRVGKIAIKNGINSGIVKTSYIGTKFAQNAIGRPAANINKEHFTIAYLGYARIDKGFYFMTDALQSLNPQTASRIKIKLAGAIHDRDIKNTLEHFKSVEIIKRYKHSELPQILSDVNLGIVPVIWEDNLPQVAIEMAACGAPVLCSDFGGASELCSSGIFKFKGGDKKDFTEKLSAIVNNPDLLEKYWQNYTGLTTMEQHIKELFTFYTGGKIKCLTRTFAGKPQKEMRVG